MPKRAAVLTAGIALAMSLPLSSDSSPGVSAGALACPARVKDGASGRFRGAGIDRLICRDLTGDGPKANCCPTGGFDHMLFGGRHGRFVVIRARHTTRP